MRDLKNDSPSGLSMKESGSDWPERSKPRGLVAVDIAVLLVSGADARIGCLDARNSPD